MRLAVEVTTCTASRTGIGYYTQHLVDALLQTRPAEDELVLISNRPPAPELASRWVANLRVSGAPIRALWMQVDAPRLLSEAGADVAAFPNYVVPMACPCPAVVFVHDLALLRMPQLFTLRKQLMMRPFLRRSLAAAQVVATVSEASRRDITDLLGIDGDRIALLPGAPHPSCGRVPPDAIARVRAHHGLARPYVLTVGTLEPRKNLLTLLAAFDAVGSGTADLDLVVVGGRGWHDRKLLRALGARGPLGHVRWLGYVSEHELVALYAGSELFVYPSRFEGFGLPVVEAMACGTPVVASDVPALREVGGDAALFVPPGDAGALAAAMSRLLTDSGAARGARERGLARAQVFSWTRTALAMWKLAHESGATRLRRRPTPRPLESAATPAPGALPPPLGQPPEGLRPREWALLATVVYADLFDAPLPIDEAIAACIGAPLDEAELRRLARGPALASHLTVHPGGYLVLAGREELVARRQEGASRTATLLERHRNMLAALVTLPFVRMAAFSGGTVHQNPGAKPDIDLFIVTAPGHVYTAYALLFLASKLTRTRRIVCPNYLIDESELGIAYHHDLFTAHQLVSARPISGSSTYLAFCRANEDWVRPFFPAFRPRDGEGVLGWPRLQRAGELALFPVARPLERILRWGWRVHLRRRAARARRPDVVLSAGILKLHLSDYRRRVLERFALRLDALRARFSGTDEGSGAVGARAVRP
jgi:glycosyltransferase involved in cell wall biosynthesis